MILADTGPLVALCDPRNARHRLALTHLAQLAPFGLADCQPVIVEACFHLPRRAQRERVRAVLEELRFDVLSTLDVDVSGAVFAWLLKYAEHQTDWADGCLAVLSGRDTTLKTWTDDREFHTTDDLTHNDRSSILVI